jgi:hypothetical protein
MYEQLAALSSVSFAWYPVWYPTYAGGLRWLDCAVISLVKTGTPAVDTLLHAPHQESERA